MRILYRTSRWAIWSRRFGSFAIPLVVIPVLMHRERLISTESFIVALGTAMAFAALAVIWAIIAFARLWESGDRGWARAGAGLFLGVVLLSPAGYAAALSLQSPWVNDVTTGPQADLPLAFADASVTRQLPASDVQRHFPNAVSRTYPAEVAAVFELVALAVAQRGWEVRRKREPAGPTLPGVVHAISMNLIGFRDEVVLQVAASGTGGDGTLVMMRSASLGPPPDLGANGERIEEFLLALDLLVSDRLLQPRRGLGEDFGGVVVVPQR